MPARKSRANRKQPGPKPSGLDYQLFDLKIERVPGEGFNESFRVALFGDPESAAGPHYRATVVSSPPSEWLSHQFRFPFPQVWLEGLLARFRALQLTSKDLQSFGGEMFRAVFAKPLLEALWVSRRVAHARDAKLRIRLLLEAPELAALPWECLFDTEHKAHLALSVETTLSRYLALPEDLGPLELRFPLRALVVVANPLDSASLDVDKELKQLGEALHPLLDSGRMELDILRPASLSALQRQLRMRPYHIFHFVGHGSYDRSSGAGSLLLEGDDGGHRAITGTALGVLLHDHRSLRLAVLNACESARSSRDDQLTSAAQSLVMQGLPAVIAMQTRISDRAAIDFTHEFYRAIADSYPVDAALAEARKFLFSTGHAVEWSVPVLLMRVPDGILLEIEGGKQAYDRHEDQAQDKGRHQAGGATPHPPTHLGASREEDLSAGTGAGTAESVKATGPGIWFSWETWDLPEEPWVWFENGPVDGDLLLLVKRSKDLRRAEVTHVGRIESFGPPYLVQGKLRAQALLKSQLLDPALPLTEDLGSRLLPPRPTSGQRRVPRTLWRNLRPLVAQRISSLAELPPVRKPRERQVPVQGREAARSSLAGSPAAARRRGRPVGVARRTETPPEPEAAQPDLAAVPAPRDGNPAAREQRRPAPGSPGGAVPVPLQQEPVTVAALYQPPPRDQAIAIEVAAEKVTLRFGDRMFQGPNRLDPEALKAARRTSPRDYGEALFRGILHDGRLGSRRKPTLAGYDLACDKGRGGLRLELLVEERLEDLRWELLADPRTRLPLAAAQRSHFSRSACTSESPPAGKARLKVLAAICNPTTLGRSEDDQGRPVNRFVAGLSPIDATQERAILEAALERLRAARVADFLILDGQDGKPVTLEALHEELERGYTALHLLAHGLHIAGEGYHLVMEDETRRHKLVPVAELRRDLVGVGLRLAVLCSCQSATPDSARALLGFGPSLASDGIPAVIAMQDELRIDTAQLFTQHFYDDLARSGRVDMAMAATRFALFQRSGDSEWGWGVPALWMQGGEGPLFSIDEAQLEELPPLVPQIRSYGELPGQGDPGARRLARALTAEALDLGAGRELIERLEAVLAGARSGTGAAEASGGFSASSLPVLPATPAHATAPALPAPPAMVPLEPAAVVPVVPAVPPVPATASAVAGPGSAQPTSELVALAPPQDRLELGSLRWPVRIQPAALQRFVESEGSRLVLGTATYGQIASALNAGKHLILIGPPGTGKTSLAHDIAEHARREKLAAGVAPATATADWTSFDTVGGYSPSPMGHSLEFRAGLFLEAIRTGRWLVIDEINRAEIDKAFGELFTVLSGQRVALPYRVGARQVRVLPAAVPPRMDASEWWPEDAGAGWDYVIHPSWRVLATMNVYDRSHLFAMSFAFMRRFAFVDVELPEREAYLGLIRRWLGGDGELGHLGERGRRVEAKLEALLSAENRLMRSRALGPAIVKDMIGYVADRLRNTDGLDPGELLCEAVLLFVTPQLDGIDRDGIVEIHQHLAQLFAGCDACASLLSRIGALYPHIPPEDWLDTPAVGKESEGHG